METTFLVELANPDINIPAVLPEMILAVTGIFIMLYDSFSPNKHAVTGTISLIGITASAAALILLWGDQGQSSFGGMILTDTLRLSFSLVFLVVTALTILGLDCLGRSRERSLPANTISCFCLRQSG